MKHTCFLQDGQASEQHCLTDRDIPWWISSEGPDPYPLRKGKKRIVRRGPSEDSK